MSFFSVWLTSLSMIISKFMYVAVNDIIFILFLVRTFKTYCPSNFQINNSVQFSSVTQLCLILCDPMVTARQDSLSINNSRSLLMSIESVMPSNLLILCCPLLLPSIFPSIRVFSDESALCMRWPKYWSFRFNISPSNEYPGLISFRMDWLDLLAVQGLSRVFSNTTVQKHQFFGT